MTRHSNDLMHQRVERRTGSPPAPISIQDIIYRVEAKAAYSPTLYKSLSRQFIFAKEHIGFIVNHSNYVRGIKWSLLNKISLS